jgi:hypothetical protein
MLWRTAFVLSMTKAEKKSCANCKFLSEATVRFAAGSDEVRVTCLKALWPNGSVLSLSVSRNPGRFTAKASECGQFRFSDS